MKQETCSKDYKKPPLLSGGFFEETVLVDFFDFYIKVQFFTGQGVVEI